MAEELKSYVLSVLIGKAENSIHDERQDKIISVLSGELYPNKDELDNKSTPICDEICSIVIRTLHYKLINGSVIATNPNIWELLTPEFCTECAYEYITTLEKEQHKVDETITR